ncbi:MAG: nucleotidyltransferase [Candidatus Melainabacteria bacterium]|nr:nucleotidyltransferase [Candidatus Melainabacteria bacterium]
MDFVFVFEYLFKEFQKENIDFAIIGGIALQAYGLARATQDIDLLVLVDNKDKVKEIMTKGGFSLLHESNDVLNFVGGRPALGRVDFLLAQRKYAFEMLKRAVEKNVLDGKFKVKLVKVEDQIGLKVQSSSNDQTRYHQDMADIEELIKNNASELDMNIIKEYFSIFNRIEELDKIIKGTKHVK